MKKTEKGITLIALIITIVVLLILAVVAITAIRNDGILSHAENAANKYNQAQQNELGILGGYEQLLNENGGNGGTGEDDNPPVSPVEPVVGQYVKYNVSYTDMYSSSKTFGETDGWRYLGTDESGNHLIISTGIPMILYYKYDATSDENSAKWWDTTQTNVNAQMAEGLKKNLAKIPYAKVSAGTINVGTANTMIGLFDGATIGSGDSAYTGVGDYFKVTGQTYTNKIVNVRTLTLAELNRATNSARAEESGYTERTETETTAGFKDIPEGNAARGLFDLSHVSGLSNNNYCWLASPNASNTSDVYFVFFGRSDVYYGYNYNGGVRPVVVLSSEIQLTDADGDGVLEIK